MHIVVEPREQASRVLRFMTPILTILLALAVSAIPLLYLRVSPLIAYRSILLGSCGDIYAFSETLVKAIPLILCGLAVAFPLAANRSNIGAEGQYLMGAFGASVIALSFPQWPGWLLMCLMILAGFAAGMFWGWIPGFLNAKFKISEIIVSLMMNYIAFNWIAFMVYGPLRDREGYSNFPLSPKFVRHAWFPRLIEGTRLHFGLVLALFAAFGLYVILKKTRIGYEIRVVGANPAAAEYGGIDTSKVVMLVMGVAGGLAALGGVGEVAALHHQLRQDISIGYGYTAIPVAMLGKGHPLGVILSGLLFAALFVGGSNMQQDVGVPSALVSVIQALVVLFLITGETLQRYRIRIIQRKGSEQ